MNYINTGRICDVTFTLRPPSLLHGVVPVAVPLLVYGGVDRVLADEPPDVDLLLLGPNSIEKFWL